MGLLCYRTRSRAFTRKSLYGCTHWPKWQATTQAESHQCTWFFVVSRHLLWKQRNSNVWD